MRRGQFWGKATKERRLQKAKLMLNKLKNPAVNNQLIIFSDEKNFSQDQEMNRKNNSWLCAKINEVPVVMATKFPTTVMVLGMVSNEGTVMPPHIFAKGLKINSEEYMKDLMEVEKPNGWSGRWPHYIFQ